jgi:putative transcriptional regulator
MTANNRPRQLPVAEQIRKGLEEAILHARGEITLKTTVLERPDPPPQVRAGDIVRLRHESGLSQAVFAQVLNVSTKTVQSCEQGARKPSQAALRLIQVFRENPSGLLEIVGMSRANGNAADTATRRPRAARKSGRP